MSALKGGDTIKKKLFGVLMAMVLCLGLLPTAWADEETAIEPVSDAAIYDVSELSKHCNTNSLSNHFYYGDVESHVIAYYGNEESVLTSELGQVTLFAWDALGGNTQFGANNEYANSALKGKMEEIAESRFSEIERAAIASRTLSSGGEDGVAGAGVSNALLWPLSIKEAKALNYYKRIHNSHEWWLRSGVDDGRVAYMNSYRSGVSDLMPKNTLGVRPAFNIDLDKVLFLTEVYRSGSSNHDWSFTLLDSSREFSAATTAVTTENNKTVLTVAYSGAKVGEQISLVVKKSEGGLTGFYKRLATQIKSTDGILEVDLSQIKLNDGDGIYLFSEQDNGSKKTNYASKPVEVDMTVPTARAIVSSFTGIEGGTSQTIRDLDDYSDYTTTLSAQAGYSLPKKIVVKVGGMVLEESRYTYSFETGKLTIAGNAITGNAEIIAAGWPNYDYDIEPGMLDFGTVKTGYRDIGKTVTITNTGAKEISIKPDTWEGSDFTVSALSKSEIASGESATFTVAPKRGLGVGTYNGSVDIYIYEDAQQTSQINIASMRVTLTVEQGNHTAPSTPRYDVAAESGAHGSVTVSPKNASKGSTVTITVTPDKGYTLETLTVTDKNGSALDLTDKGGGQYTFTMPSGPVTVAATFMDDNTMLSFFVDVPASAYYYDAVLWAAEGGIVTGTDAVHFSPDASCTRAQLVTFLWRAADSPVVNYAMRFNDVDGGAYYTEAVRWAASLGIVGGYGDGRFGTNDFVTREQVAAMLYRFAKAQGMDTTQGGMAAREFDDLESASPYALEAVDWAVNAGVLNGDNNRLLPQDNCTRAQIVTMLYRVLGEK